MAVVAALSVHLATPVRAATNSTVNFQARLQTAGGAIVADGYYNVEFKLYNTSSSSGSTQGSCSGDASCLWAETWYDSNGVSPGNDNRLRVKNGYLTVSLGSLNAFPGSINWDQDLWVTIRAGGSAQTATPTYDAEMNPRLRLSGVPYAFRAGELAKNNGSYTSVLQLVAPTGGDQTFQIPDQGAAGTYTLLTANAANASYVQFAPSSAQTDASTNASIFVDKTGASGNLLDLNKNGSDILTVQYAGTLNVHNNIINQVDRVIFADPGPSEGLVWGGTAANWSVDVTPLDRSNADGNLNLYGTSNSVAIWRPTLQLYDATNYTTATAQSDGGTLYTTTGSGNLLFNPGGNVAVGSASAPGYKLDVTGDINSSANLRTGGTVRLDNAGGLSNITGYSQSSGNFAQTGGGTFATGTGSISLNGDVTVASGKNLTLTSGNINANGTITGSTLIEKTTSFTPTTTGWYRIMAGTDGSDGGTIRINQLSPAYDGRVTDIEFQFNINGNGNGGAIQQTRYTNVGGGVIDQVRISSDGGNNTYLDIRVSTATSPQTVTIYGYGANLPALEPSPVVGAVAGSTDVQTISLANGLRTTSSILSVGSIRSNNSFNINGTTGATTTCSGGQVLQNIVVAGGIVTGGSCVANDAGVTTMGTIDSQTKSANGAVISGSNLVLQTADGSNVGLVSTGSQAFGGNKTFNNNVTVSGLLSLGGTISGAGLTDCQDSSTTNTTVERKLTYNGSTNQFGCASDGTTVVAKKGSDESYSSTTFHNDNTLSFSIGANESWYFEIFLSVTMSTANFKFQMTGPSGVTCNFSAWSQDANGNGMDTNNSGCASSISSGASQNSQQWIYGTVSTGANAGTINLQWARITGSGTVTVKGGDSVLKAYKVNGADYAETYFTKDFSLAAGDVVALDKSFPAGVKKAVSPYQKDAVGIISTQPGQVVGDAAGAAHGRPVPLALNGRVPVKVSTVNGPIEAGDYLTASSIPGVAMKATKPGQMIGKAMEAYNGATGGQGMVMAFVNLVWADPTDGSAGLEQAADNLAQRTVGLLQQSNLTVQDLYAANASLASLKVTGDATFGGLLTAADNLRLAGHLITGGRTPRISLQPAAGSAADGAGYKAKALIVGNDTGGKITLTLGDLPEDRTGDLVKVSFDKPFGKEPQVVVSPRSAGAARLQAYINQVGSGYFTVAAAGDLQAGVTYELTYYTFE